MKKTAKQQPPPNSQEKPGAPIPMVDLHAQFDSIREEIRAAIEEVLASQQFVLGPQLLALEQEIAGSVGRKFAVGVGSGTDALILALHSCGVGPGDQVLVPAFTFLATASAVTALQARPVFVDVLADTFNLNPSQLEARITSRTRAIVPVHLFGLPADMDAILQICQRRGLAVIEDNAQAIHARYKARITAAIGSLGCLSFYPSKNLGAYGDAGMIVTDSGDLAARLRSLRNHGQTGKYLSSEQGWNSRLDELQAAVLRVKLRHLDRWTAARQAHASEYNRRLAAIPGVVVPVVPPGHEHVYHQYTIRVRDRDRVQEFLSRNGISSAVYYPVPLHLQPLFSALGHRRGEFPVAERAAEEVLSLPMYPELEVTQIERVAGALAAALR